MRTRQGNTILAFQGAASMCVRYLEEVFPTTPDWTVPKNFTIRLQQFQQVIASIHQLAVVQGASVNNGKTATLRAQAAQERLRAELMVIRQAARAIEWDIPGLAAKCRIPAIRSRHSEWHKTAKAVLESAQPHFSTLVDEGVPADTLRKIEQADADFAQAIADGIAARQERTSATQQLPKLVTRGHQLLASLSVTMRAYYAAHPQHASGIVAWAHASHVRRDRRRSPRQLSLGAEEIAALSGATSQETR